MAFRVPVFNVWGEVIDQDIEASRGHTICQVRGPTNVPVLMNQTMTIDQTRIVWEILFPRGSDVRGGNNSGQTVGDRFIVCGTTHWLFYLTTVGDKAAGFSNEYRLAYALHSFEGGGVKYLSRLNTDYRPPAGYTPLPIVPRQGE